ncbi:hypothetical protein DFH07DRAFT_781932 [Mycena maculata]|uniref:Uncharacterized protein n=1 Tax=Mycena maculata TaxID=230809 RepID=A0AAD7HWX1_9AGAR|nr:hypothetical protein DFH07DRAFT_781932 [Mycena maculata]
MPTSRRGLYTAGVDVGACRVRASLLTFALGLLSGSFVVLRNGPGTSRAKSHDGIAEDWPWKRMGTAFLRCFDRYFWQSPMGDWLWTYMGFSGTCKTFLAITDLSKSRSAQGRGWRFLVVSNKWSQKVFSSANTWNFRDTCNSEQLGTNSKRGRTKVKATAEGENVQPKDQL